ncbi:CCA tRNA nucleotidyltransferase [Faecalibacterium prausnitzii]|uniref:CCA tRNA nucleotidyltransferase n=1 Tax=Faecalibacterium prausnitzii TaxID=853 RepID=UPI001CBD50DF|nr:CCA tRNA nucleotidyltransferase [Faecalibacterium prausnitzii]
MTAETISFPLDPGAAALLTRLHTAGHAAYAVGGCVRDSLLGQTPHDWDLCTSATPEQVLELFGEAHCIPTGLQHGTVTVKHGGELYEITTFRTEGAYSDGRHPDHVAFVPDVKEDLARRDFTINAMAYNAEEGLIDPFGGQSDLAAGIVRAVGEPQRRFEEDALRILRLYRFAARFGFAIDPATGQAARALCRHLDCVSEERIAEELSRLLAAPAPGAYLEAEVLAVIFPELDAAELPESRRILDALEPGMEHVPVRLAALLCPLGEAGARAALKRLKCSNALSGTVATLVREAAAGMPGAALTLTAKRFLSRYDLATITDLTALCSAQHPEQAEAFAALQQEAARLVETNACCRINQLAVNGRDLMDAGIRPGPGLRRVLDALLEQVLTGQLPNEKAALLAAAAQVAAS